MLAFGLVGAVLNLNLLWRKCTLPVGSTDTTNVGHELELPATTRLALEHADHITSHHK